MEAHLQVVGILLILLALMHIAFPAYFGWKEELAPLSLLTRQIMYVHTFFIGLVVLLIGVVSFFYTDHLLSEKTGNILCIGFAFFWVTRLFFQCFVYSPTLWRGKPFETFVHVIFTLLWIYISVVYILAIRF